MKHKIIQRESKKIHSFLGELNRSKSPSRTISRKGFGDELLIRSLYIFQKALGISLRDDQIFNICLAVLHTEDRGWFEKPTGAGKAYEQAFVLYYSAVSTEGNWVGLLNSPTIELTDQNAKAVIELFSVLGISCRLVLLHSGNSSDSMERLINEYRPDESPQIPVTNTTSGIEIKRIIEQSKESYKEQKILIISTYHSCSRLEGLELDIIVNDEMQNLTKAEFFENVSKLSITKMFGWTATPKNGLIAEGRGNNNIDFYGERLSLMTYQEAVRKKIIVPCRIHIMDGPSYKTEDVTKNIGNITIDAYREHNEIVKSDSTFRRRGKMIAHCKDTEQISAFLTSEEYRKARTENINVAAVASKTSIGYQLNGKTYRKRSDFTSALKEIASNPLAKLIVLHIHILNEGIDIPSLTGGLILNPASEWYLIIQRIGRSGRLDIEDRKLGSLSIKPYNYIIIPRLSIEQEEGFSSFTGLIDALRTVDDISSLYASAIGDFERGTDRPSVCEDCRQNPCICGGPKPQGLTIAGVFRYTLEQEDASKTEERKSKLIEVLYHNKSTENLLAILDGIDF
jgi:superfamily II DNA or RNA helicase